MRKTFGQSAGGGGRKEVEEKPTTRDFPPLFISLKRSTLSALTLAAVWKLLTVLPSSLPREGSLDGPVGFFFRERREREGEQ